MKTSTRDKMQAYAQTLPPSSTRAQAYRIAQLPSGEGIAQALADDHGAIFCAQRAARLMVDAGCATEKKGNPGCFGVFTFEDGSQL